MSLAIRGLGTAVPTNAMDQAVALAVATRICCRTEEQASLLPSLYRQTGIETRHVVFAESIVRDVLNGTAETQSVYLPREEADDRGPSTRERMREYAENALPLARHAAGLALEQSGLRPEEITHLVIVSCTGFSAPGVDCGLIYHLHLAPTVQRVQVGFMGCHGAVNGLRVAQAFTGSQAEARVLLCAVELCSLHYFYGWDPKKLVANSLFADGAAALVGTNDPCPGSGTWRATGTGSCLFPRTAYAMTWDIGDHGFEMSLSTRVPGLIADHLRPWLESWLGQHGLQVAEVGSWAVHPGGPRILSAVEECLRLPPEALSVSREVLGEFGNMSSPTLLFILERLRRCQAPRPCVALGFGPGLVVEAALFR
jgi:predicted naringenin-chalcone synthase